MYLFLKTSQSILDNNKRMRGKCELFTNLHLELFCYAGQTLFTTLKYVVNVIKKSKTATMRSTESVEN